MRVGLISDIHANLPALEAVLADMPPVEAIVSAGDTIGYYPWPDACIDELIEREVPAVMGNHDRALIHETTFAFRGSARAGLELANNKLQPHHRDWLHSLPDDRVLFEDRLRIVHGHPRDPDRYTYPADVDEHILMDEPVLVLGHTHIQFSVTLESGIVVNPGSVGQPRDGDPRAAYAVVDLDRLKVTEHRVDYDINRTAEAVREHDLPNSLATRLFEGR